MQKVLRMKRVMVALVCFALIGCQADSAETVASPKPVRLFEVQEQEPLQTRQFVGRVNALTTVDLAFQVGGELVELPIQQGSVVPAGELIAALDPTDYQRQLEQAKVQYDQARRELERGRPLREKGFLTPSALDTLESNFELARVARDRAQRNLDYTRLHAPFDALISRRLIERFSSVQAGMPLVRVQDVTELRVQINVPEQLMMQAQRGQGHEIYASFSQLPDLRLPLTYREHATEADPVTQTYAVTFALPRPEEASILPGMTLTVTVLPDLPVQTQTTWWIPFSALDTRQADAFQVWIYDAASAQVMPRQVEVGRLLADQVEILQGLSLGEQIVSSGISHLHPGQPVRPFTGF